MRFFGGSATFDGVTLNFTNGWSFRQHGESRFLAYLYYLCGGAAAPADDADGWFEIDRTDRLRSTSDSDAAREMLRLGTVTRVRDWIRSRR